MRNKNKKARQKGLFVFGEGFGYNKIFIKTRGVKYDKD